MTKILLSPKVIPADASIRPYSKIRKYELNLFGWPHSVEFAKWLARNRFWKTYGVWQGRYVYSAATLCRRWWNLSEFERKQHLEAFKEGWIQ